MEVIAIIKRKKVPKYKTGGTRVMLVFLMTSKPRARTILPAVNLLQLKLITRYSHVYSKSKIVPIFMKISYRSRLLKCILSPSKLIFVSLGNKNFKRSQPLHRVYKQK
jgi:hypothetical protein